MRKKRFNYNQREAIGIEFNDEEYKIFITYRTDVFDIDKIINSGITNGLLFKFRTFKGTKRGLIVELPYSQKDDIINLISIISNEKYYIK